jgi:mono/diheme cytochrome c family protein
LRRISILALSAVAIPAGFLFLTRGAGPAPSVHITMTPSRVARGKYVYTVAGCDGCHSPRDWSRFAGPVAASKRGQGVGFPAELGFGTDLSSANITPDAETGIGLWSDGEKIRAIRDGIGRGGRTLHPLMRRYRRMSDEDVYSLVAYLNTLHPLRHAVGKPTMPFLWPLLARENVRPAGRVAEPDRHNRIRYGEYLATMAGCRGCHTAARTSPFGRALFAGGRRFHLAGGTVISTNITPDPYTGIGRWSEQDWVDRVYRYREYAEQESPKVGPGSLTVMPWLELSQMREDDLKAIFAYFRAQKPVYRLIDPHPVN